MKKLLLSLLVTASAAFAGDFSGTAGLQLYSLRDSFKADVPGTLDKVKALGFKEVETASTYGIEPEKFAGMLKERGLTPVSAHFQYDALKKDIGAAVKEAQALGVKYAMCPWIPHEVGNFTQEDAKRASADFNAWGEAFKAAGITFGYHPHGYEFRPLEEGSEETMLDLMMRETKPEFVAFEMDVFWVTHPGKDPVRFLEKYPTRWQLMHLKDVRKGARIGVYTGQAPKTDGVALGTGLVDWPAVLRTAAKVGVKHYFIEDEAPTVEEQIPATLKYLESLK